MPKQVSKTSTDESSESCVLSLQSFPRDLKKRLKMKAAEREIDLKDLCAEYLEASLERANKGKTE